MPWLCEACHSRGSENLETFAMGRLGIGRAALGSWSPIGVGDELRGNDGGAVDSRFHGNDRWGGMVEGGNDRWAAMAVGGNDRWGGNGGRRGWPVGGDDGWAGMVVGGNDGWVGMTGGGQ